MIATGRCLMIATGRGLIIATGRGLMIATGRGLLVVFMSESDSRTYDPVLTILKTPDPVGIMGNLTGRILELVG